MLPAFELRCRACGEPAGDVAVQYCARCFGPLELHADWAALGRSVDAGAIATGPPDLRRYRLLLPVEPATTAGWTPLRQADALAAAIGFDGELWVKDETCNPTGSFKDRLVSMAIAKAQADGASVVATASTGNLARAVLAAARAVGLEAVVLVPEGTSIAGAFTVDGAYDALNRLTAEAAAEYPEWAWVNVSLRPWYVEGAATLGYETAEQLGWRTPDHVVAPIASGATLLRLHRAFDDLAAAGLLTAAPVKVSATQPTGCAPVADAFARGDADVAPVRSTTSVTSLAMGDPPDGVDLLAAVRASGGAVVAVAEDVVARGVDTLTESEGIVGEDAVGVAVEGLRQLVEDGAVRPGERIVLYAMAGPAPDVGKVEGPRGVSIAATLDGLAAVLPEHLREENHS